MDRSTLRQALLPFVLVLSATPLFAQLADVRYQGGLLSVHCDGAPLSSVFDQIHELAGVELILEDPVKNTPITASLDEVPLSMAVQRILEGSGVVFAVMMDPRDWGRVDKVFIGAAGGGPARSAPPARPAQDFPEPEEDDEMNAEDDFANDDFANDDFAGDEVDDALDGPEDAENPDELQDPGSVDAPPADVPVPSYLPPQQNFRRSRFTPGPPNQGASNPSAEPPFPFLDAFGQSTDPEKRKPERNPPNEP